MLIAQIVEGAECLLIDHSLVVLLCANRLPIVTHGRERARILRSNGANGESRFNLCAVNQASVVKQMLQIDLLSLAIQCMTDHCALVGKIHR